MRQSAARNRWPGGTGRATSDGLVALPNRLRRAPQRRRRRATRTSTLGPSAATATALTVSVYQGIVVVVATYVRLQRRVREGRRRPVPVAHNSHLEHRLRIRYDNTERGDAGPAHTPRATSGPRLARRINNLMQRSTRCSPLFGAALRSHPAINPQRNGPRHLTLDVRTTSPSGGHPTCSIPKPRDDATNNSNKEINHFIL